VQVQKSCLSFVYWMDTGCLKYLWFCRASHKLTFDLELHFTCPLPLLRADAMDVCISLNVLDLALMAG